VSQRILKARAEKSQYNLIMLCIVNAFTRIWLQMSFRHSWRSLMVSLVPQAHVVPYTGCARDVVKRLLQVRISPHIHVFSPWLLACTVSLPVLLQTCQTASVVCLGEPPGFPCKTGVQKYFISTAIVLATQSAFHGQIPCNQGI
jgi:hypothetical protein